MKIHNGDIHGACEVKAQDFNELGEETLIYFHLEANSTAVLTLTHRWTRARVLEGNDDGGVEVNPPQRKDVMHGGFTC